jgi:hypothetical protein
VPRTPLPTTTLTRQGLPAASDAGAEMRTSAAAAHEGAAQSAHTIATMTRAADRYRIPLNRLPFAILSPTTLRRRVTAMLPPMKTALTKPFIVATIVALAATLAACSSSKSDSSTNSSGGGGGAKSESSSSHEAKVIGSSTAKGSFPATLAHATVDKPGAIQLTVTPTPAQKTAMSWNVACRRGTSAGNKHGRYNVTAASTKTLKLPLAHSDSCVVSASAQMSKSGTIKVEIIG